MKNAEQVLVEQIERLVREHVEATQRAAAEALARAFGSALAPPSSGRRAPHSKAVPRRTSGGRRTAAELSALGERLFEAVRSDPGETMTRLAPMVGATPRELARPMSMLRRSGRIRSVGQRHQTRYFPAVARPSSDSAS